MNCTLWPGRVLISLLLLAPATGVAADKQAATTQIDAAGGAGAHTITGGTFNIYNHDPEEIKRLADRLNRSEGDRRAAEAKANELAIQLNLHDVTTQTVVGFLRVLARQQDLKLEQVPGKMAEITASYLQMQERLANLAPQDPGAADLAQEAADASRAGRFEEADRLLAEAEARETAAIDEHRRKAAQLRAARGDNAETRLQHAEAASHYEAAAEMLPPDAATAKGLYLVKAGDLRLTLGTLAPALTNFQAAHAVFERLSKADPDNAKWQGNLSISHERIGDVQQAQGDLSAALTSYQAILTIRGELAKADPANLEWQSSLSISHERIGDVQQAQGNLSAALTSYQASLLIWERLAKADPVNLRWQRGVIVPHHRIGDVQQVQGNLAEALTSYRAALAIAEKLARMDPSNAEWRRGLSVSQNKIGDVLVAEGDREGALRSYREGLAIIETLARRDPGNTQWQRDLSISHDRIGDVLVAEGDREGALRSYREGLAIRETLARRDPGNAEWQRDLIVSCVKIAGAHPDAAPPMLKRALDIAKQLQASGKLAPVDAWLPDELERRLAQLTAEKPASP
jgi:tetratricopeptide (TPR) repeat protein